MLKLVVFITSSILGLIVLWLGLSGNKFLFITDTRSAAITLVSIGFLMCSTGALSQFITKAPAHPLTILGYLIGTVLLVILLTQIFNWNIPFIKDSQNALITIAILILVKVVIARFIYLIK